MKTIVLFTRRNTGLCALAYFVAAGYNVKVVTDDAYVAELATNLKIPIVTQDIMGDYDVIASVHWNKIIPERYLLGKKSFNVHPCLFKYKGKDPIAKYIANEDTLASVESHVMTKDVDEGEVIYQEFFETGVVSSYAEFYNTALPVYFRVFAETMKRIK